MMRKPAFLFCFLLIGLGLQAQHPEVSSRNGYWMPNKDTIRVFLVFAEVLNDPDDKMKYGPDARWRRGQMPINADEYFDHSFRNEKQIKSRITKFFYQASFGEYILIGDYYPELVQVPFRELKGNGDENVINYLEALPGDDIITAHGYSLKDGDFDLWSTPSGYGMPKTKGADGYTDFLMILWRVNSKVTRSDNSGSVNVGKWRKPLKSSQGFMDRSRFVSKHSGGGGILQHEYSHSLYGGNNFHTGGRGAGNTTFIHAMGGYGNLSSFGSSSTTWNAWDRHRMGWKAPDKEYHISAICASTGQEISTDLKYGEEPCPGMEFWMDDFVDRGDAIRIELPYVQTDNPQARRQYLWLENHRMRPGRIDHWSDMTKGVYAYIQVGKDDTTDFGGPGLYTAPLNAWGHHDFVVDPEDKSIQYRRGRENPLSGLHFSMIPAWNKIEPNVKKNGRGEVYESIEGMILREETVYPEKVMVGAAEMSEDEFHFKTHPSLGTIHDAFVPGDVISIANNPTPSSMLTWESKGTKKTRQYESPRPQDNRQIYLNGIKVELLEENRLEGGKVKVRISWEGDQLEDRVRWCGPISTFDDIQLGEKAVLILDLGLSPQKPVNPIRFKGEMIFSDSTVLRVRGGAKIELEKDARIVLRNGSRLIFEDSSSLHLGPGADLIIDRGSYVTFTQGSQRFMEAGSCVDVLNGAFFRDYEPMLEAESSAKTRVRNGGNYAYYYQEKSIEEFLGSGLKLGKSARFYSEKTASEQDPEP